MGGCDIANSCGGGIALRPTARGACTPMGLRAEKPFVHSRTGKISMFFALFLSRLLSRCLARCFKLILLHSTYSQYAGGLIYEKVWSGSGGWVGKERCKLTDLRTGVLGLKAEAGMVFGVRDCGKFADAKFGQPVIRRYREKTVDGTCSLQHSCATRPIHPC